MGDNMTKMKKPTTFDMITASVVQDYAHASTRDIVRFRDVELVQLKAVEEHIVNLQATLDEEKTERTKLTAILAGLGQVIGKR
jgi:hypothetical protein